MTTLVHALQQRHARTATTAVRPSGRGRRRTLLVCGDVGALAGALVVAGAPGWAFALVPAALGALGARGQYRAPRGSAVDVVLGALGAVSIAAGALLLAAATLAPTRLPAATLGHAWLLACGLVAAHRLAALTGRPRERRAAVVVLGEGAAADDLARHVEPVAVLPLGPAGGADGADARGLARLAREAGGRDVLIVPGTAGDAAVAAVARACAAEGLGVAIRSAVGDAGAALAVEHAGPVALVRLRPVDRASAGLAVKHALDRAVAALLVLSVAPLFAALALAVRLSSPGPVLYRQRRVGRDGREFAMLKFRSMRAAPAADTALVLPPWGAAPGGVEGADRRTRVGALLRRTSLDELPQLLNVLRGEMSLVGPRPERPEFVDRFSRDVDRYADRHRLKSGMTGLAQVNGLRGRTSIRDRVAYDNHYVEHWSLGLDLRILLRTITAVLRPAE